MRLILFSIFFVACVLCQSTVRAAKAADRPNILWIIADDMGAETGCYGTPLMRTPNIDQLAREGVRYTRAYTTAPVCSPSRSALMTGMYQTTINAHDHRSMTTLPPNIKTITDHFRSAGYFTCNIKKTGSDLESHGKTDYNFKVENPFDGEDFTELKNKQPFFAEFQIFEPHRGSWGPSKKELDYHIDPTKVKLPAYYADDPVVRKDWAGYLDAIDYLDGKVGKIRRLLEQEGLATNTIIFFFGDNGRCHFRDKQWPYEGGLHIPLIVHWPGKLKPAIKDDLVSAIDISATSLSLAGVKLPKNMQGRIFFGRGAKKRDYIFGARDRCDETVDRIRSVRDDRYRYIRNFMPERPYTQRNAYKERAYPALNVMKELHAAGRLTPEQDTFFAEQKPNEELYDLKNDPDEVHNLALSPKHQKILKHLREVLADWMRECDDRPDKHGDSRK